MGIESKRQQRFAGIIQQDLAEIFLREGNTWLPGVMITVTRVRITSDLGIARVYLSFLPVKDPQEALEKIRNHGNEVRYKLGTRIRNQTKSIPVLEFYVDDSNDYMEHMDKLFEGINKDKQSEDE
ncbi:ribosome-binding factor A [Albibacterium bauzanense]|uniref:Ribosome-binding factor A n=1 Tax=Albibacterium bauzanense TaxID=653929 RepID=A0A4R1LUI1_9SPHI|nr:ribosome-binding factor A [Albibacterium bauzanense]TCK83018.1 ribosome-binding factor A [Albibacterium bauzanense]